MSRFRVLRAGVPTFAVFAACMSAHAAPLTVKLRPAVTVDRPQVELADIAELEGEPDRRAAAEHIVVAQAPRVGYVQRLTPPMLATVLRRTGIKTDIAWSGAPMVQVSTASRTIPGHDLTESAVSALRHADPRGDFVFRIARTVEGVDVPSGPTSLRVRPLDAGAFSPRMSVWVDVIVDGTVYRSAQVPVEVDREQLVLVARNDLRAGEFVGADRFDAVLRNTAGQHYIVAGELASGERMRLAKPLRAGEALSKDKLVADGGVLPGDRVHVVARAGAAGVETDGVVVRGGAHGQLVEVRVANSAQIIAGTLLNDRTVSVQ